MKKFSKIMKWIVVIGLCLFGIVQFIRPARTNPVVDQSLDISAHVPVNSEIAAILDRSCADCHSDRTRWPWYTNVAPVSWFVINHVDEGRRHLNISEWGKYNSRQQGAKLKEMCELSKTGAMPLSSYTPMHANSKLTSEQIQTLCDWTTQQRAALGSH